MSNQDLFKYLAKSLSGSLLQQEDWGYDKARAIWNGRINRRPMAIARCKDTSDVIATINFARDHQLLVSIRGGGHHVAGHAVCDNGIMIDLSLMDDVLVDPGAKTAQVGPGANIRDLDYESQAFGLVTTGAPVSTVGIAGYTLGGGLGWTSRKHGLACDNLLSADVVTADGKLIRTSEDNHPDLFWALRGGSGNFGVVTSFEFRLYKMGPKILAGPLVYSMEAAPELLRFWRNYMLEASDELQCMPVIFNTAESETVFCLYPLYAGDPDKGKEVIAPLREEGNPISDNVAVVPYAGLLLELDEMYRSGDRNYYRSAFFDSLPDEAIDTFVEKAAPIPSPFSSIFLEPLGGAIARRDTHATAFPHRERKFCITAVPKWDDEIRDEEMMTWADELFNALKPYAADGVYVNYLDEVGDEPGRDAYGQHWNHLAELKKKWDPENLFRMNHNIPPARSSLGEDK